MHLEELVRNRVRIIGIVLANMVSFLSPEMFVLGGGLTDAMPSLVRDEVAAGIQAHAIPDALQGLKIVTAKNKGHAVTVGAAKLALGMPVLSLQLRNNSLRSWKEYMVRR